MLTVDTEIQVTREQYKLLKVKLSGIIAHRQHDGNFYIKCLWQKYCALVYSIIKYIS